MHFSAITFTLQQLSAYNSFLCLVIHSRYFAKKSNPYRFTITHICHTTEGSKMNFFKPNIKNLAVKHMEFV